jgi:hypothetical protein
MGSVQKRQFSMESKKKMIERGTLIPSDFYLQSTHHLPYWGYPLCVKNVSRGDSLQSWIGCGFHNKNNNSKSY